MQQQNSGTFNLANAFQLLYFLQSLAAFLIVWISQLVSLLDSLLVHCSVLSVKSTYAAILACALHNSLFVYVISLHRRSLAHPALCCSTPVPVLPSLQADQF